MPNPANSTDALESRVANVRRSAAELRAALTAGNSEIAILVASRMRVELEAAERTATLRGVERQVFYDEIVTVVVELQREALPLLACVPPPPGTIVVRRYLARLGAACLARYRSGGVVNARGEHLAHLILECADLRRARLDTATLRDVVIREADLTDARADRVAMRHVNLAHARMGRAAFHDALFEACTLDYASLVDARLGRSMLVRCSLRGADLRDAQLDGTRLVACDLRDAVLDARRERVLAYGAHFMRCDLRGSSWAERDLDAVTFEDCAMHDVRGTPRASRARVSRPDLSAAGDGSRVVTIRFPELLWPARS